MGGDGRVKGQQGRERSGSHAAALRQARCQAATVRLLWNAMDSKRDSKRDSKSSPKAGERLHGLTRCAGRQRRHQR